MVHDRVLREVVEAAAWLRIVHDRFPDDCCIHHAGAHLARAALVAGEESGTGSKDVEREIERARQRIAVRSVMSDRKDI